MWPRSDLLTVVGLLIALVGTIAAIQALPSKRGRFWLTVSCITVFIASVLLIRLGTDAATGPSATGTASDSSTSSKSEVLDTVDRTTAEPPANSSLSPATDSDLQTNPPKAVDTAPNDAADGSVSATEEPGPPLTPLQSLTFTPPLQCEMSFTQDAGWFQKDRSGALRVDLYAITLMSTKRTLELKLSICNTGDEGVEYLPFFAWYTFERPRYKTTIHWLLPDDYEATNWLTVGDCHMVTIASHDNDAAHAGTALDEPLGVVHFSLNNNESFCDVGLRGRGKARRGAG